ncbi:hypothetical protein ABW365_19980 [Enterococcus avium]
MIVAKFESEETRLIERRRLLDQLGMRQKEQRSVLKRQVGFFTVLPLAVGFLLSLGFIGIMEDCASSRCQNGCSSEVSFYWILGFTYSYGELSQV